MLKHGCWHEEFPHSAVPVWLMDHMLTVLTCSFDVCSQVWAKRGSCLSRCCRSSDITVFLFRLSVLLQKRIWPLHMYVMLEAHCIKFQFSGLISYFDCLWMKVKCRKFTPVCIHNGESVKWGSYWKCFAGCGIFYCHSSILSKLNNRANRNK